MDSIPKKLVMALPWHLYLMASLYILAGLNHFRKPQFYIRIIPSYFPNPKLLNILSGGAEIILGVLLCIPSLPPMRQSGSLRCSLPYFPPISLCIWMTKPVWVCQNGCCYCDCLFKLCSSSGPMNIRFSSSKTNNH